MTDVSIILPSYKPDEKLPETVRGLCDAGFTDLCVVDDGGGTDFIPAAVLVGGAGKNGGRTLRHSPAAGQENTGAAAARPAQ